MRLTFQYEQYMRYIQINFKKYETELILKNVKQALCDNKNYIIITRNIKT